MKLKLLTIAVAAAGLTAAAQTASAMPAPRLGAIATSTGVTQTHYSARKHTHKNGHVVWQSNKRDEDMTTGRSSSKSNKNKNTGKSSDQNQNMNPDQNNANQPNR